jgi:putative ABC transport system permease protein
MLRLLRISARGTKRLFAVGAAGVATGAFMVVFFLGLVAGIQNTIETKIFPEGTIEVLSSRSDVLNTVSFLAGKKGDSGSITTARLEGMHQMAGVENVYPRLRFMFPAKAFGGREVFGFDGGTDIVGDGIPASLLRKKALRDKFTDFYDEDSAAPCSSDKACGEGECCFMEEGKGMGQCRHPVPFIVSNRLIEIYNTVIAPAHNLVALPEWTINKAAGMRLGAIIGSSYQSKANKGRPEKVCLSFTGVSRQAVDIGISVPLAYAERWNEKYADGYARGSYSSAVLTISRKQNLGSIIQRLKAKGFSIKSTGEEELGFFVGILNGIFIFISILMVLVSSIGISHIFYGIVVERKKEIGLMRALGASKRLIMNLYLAQGLIVGLGGGLGGVFLAILASYVADFLSINYLPDFPFKPERFFSFEPWIILLALVLSLASCVAGAYWPARKASRQNPMEVLD